jgi:hypothetical protein
MTGAHRWDNQFKKDGDAIAARLATQEADMRSRSNDLREACLSMFARFEERHGLPPGTGHILQLNGYRP